MNVLSICSGIGGLELGIKLVCSSARVICYVEREAHAVAVLAARMGEGFLDEAPIYADIESFRAGEWRGKVDIVTAGFPCQPFSVAGKREGERDSRYIWPSIAKAVSECSPTLVFLENVNVEAFRGPWRDLRGMGYEMLDPFACSAAELGAGHPRRRVFVLAYRPEDISREALPSYGKRGRWDRLHEREQSGRMEADSRFGDQGKETGLFANPEQGSRDKSGRGRGESGEGEAESGPADAWWASEPRVERVVHGVPNRMDRDRALGNAVVPQMAAFAFWTLIQRL